MDAAECRHVGLAKMNHAIRGTDAQFAHGNTFHNHCHPGLNADYILANPPSTTEIGAASCSTTTIAGYTA